MKYFFYIIIVLFLVSCTSNTIYEKPKDLIPKDTMALLISDMMIAKAAKSHKNNNLEVKINYMPLVYNKFKIDSIRFSESNFYYTSKIEVYEEIMLDVKDVLTKKEEKYALELKIKDSIESEKLKSLKTKKLKELSKLPKKDRLINDKEFLPLNTSEEKLLKNKKK